MAYTKCMVEGLEKEREKWAIDHAAEIKKQEDLQKFRDASRSFLK